MASLLVTSVFISLILKALKQILHSLPCTHWSESYHLLYNKCTQRTCWTALPLVTGRSGTCLPSLLRGIKSCCQLPYFYSSFTWHCLMCNLVTFFPHTSSLICGMRHNLVQVAWNKVRKKVKLLNYSLNYNDIIIIILILLLLCWILTLVCLQARWGQ